ncbi:MAG: nucleoid-associated protein [Anaerolineaceae bacterium]|nr:nucleoid-associated protein [Anaerolineaceae bacterium]
MDNLVIDQCIVHKIYHKSNNQPQLSDLETQLSQRAENFIKNHISQNYEHKYTRSAIFSTVPDGRPCLKNMCEGLLIPSSFIQSSRDIAIHLFECQKSDQKISEGDLVICTYTKGKKSEKKNVALLKLDPEEGYIGIISEIDGKVQIQLEYIGNVLPTGDLQKCAFILPPNSNEEYDLRVLDQQASKRGISRLIASFFLVDFLQCKILVNPADQTTIFIHGSNDWLMRQKGVWSNEEIFHFTEKNLSFLDNEIVDVTEFAQSAIHDPVQQDEYLNELQQQGIQDFTFYPDPIIKEKLNQFAWFEGDNGLKIRINNEAIGEGKTLYYKKIEYSNEYQVIINTSNWERKCKG